MKMMNVYDTSASYEYKRQSEPPQTSTVTEAVQTLEKNDCLQSQDKIIMVMNVMYVKPDNYD